MADGGTPPDPLDFEMRSLVDRSRVEQAVEERRRRIMLRQQAAESGSLVGSMLDLAEHGVIVTVLSGAAHRSRGRIRMIGADFVGLVDDAGTTTLICLDAVAMLRAEPGAADTIGDRMPIGSATLLETLLVETGNAVLVRTMWDESVAGSLSAVGSDVVIVRTDTGRSVYLARNGITEVSLM